MSDKQPDNVTGDWWASFNAMLTEKQQEYLGISESRGATICITRLASAYSDALSRIEKLENDLALGIDVAADIITREQGEAIANAIAEVKADCAKMHEADHLRIAELTSQLATARAEAEAANKRAETVTKSALELFAAGLCEQTHQAECLAMSFAEFQQSHLVGCVGCLRQQLESEQTINEKTAMELVELVLRVESSTDIGRAAGQYEFNYLESAFAELVAQLEAAETRRQEMLENSQYWQAQHDKMAAVVAQQSREAMVAKLEYTRVTGENARLNADNLAWETAARNIIRLVPVAADSIHHLPIDEVVKTYFVPAITPVQAGEGIPASLATLNITADSLFARIEEELERGNQADARALLDFVDKLREVSK